jgi:hypothetical protein
LVTAFTIAANRLSLPPKNEYTVEGAFAVLVPAVVEFAFVLVGPFNRYNLAAWMPLKYNADGSLDPPHTST